MLAGGDIAGGESDLLSVFDDGRALLDVHYSQLVAERHGLRQQQAVFVA
jgi:hypothetical protein